MPTKLKSCSRDGLVAYISCRDYVKATSADADCHPG